MDKVNTSRFLNYLTGGSKEELLCSRLHREKRVVWIHLINLVFRDRLHVVRAYRWERRSKMYKCDTCKKPVKLDEAIKYPILVALDGRIYERDILFCSEKCMCEGTAERVI